MYEPRNSTLVAVEFNDNIYFICLAFNIRRPNILILIIVVIVVIIVVVVLLLVMVAVVFFYIISL